MNQATLPQPKKRRKGQMSYRAKMMRRIRNARKELDTHQDNITRCYKGGSMLEDEYDAIMGRINLARQDLDIQQHNLYKLRGERHKKMDADKLGLAIYLLAKQEVEKGKGQ